MLDILRGLRTAPWLVAIARGLAGAVVAFLLLWLGDATNVVSLPPAMQQAAPLLLFALRALEGTLDQADPAKLSNAHGQVGPAG